MLLEFCQVYQGEFQVQIVSIYWELTLRNGNPKGRKEAGILLRSAYSFGNESGGRE